MFYSTYCRLLVLTTDSNFEVVKASWGMINHKARYSRGARAARHEFYRQMLALHHRDQELLRRAQL